jgi:hypothetical protein
MTVTDPPGGAFEIPILLSAISIESYVNELTDLAKLGAIPQASPSMRSLAQVLEGAEGERASTALKIQLAHLVLTGLPLAKGSQPYQDVELLLDLRNRIVHSRAELILMPADGGPAPDKPPIVRRFVSRGVIAEPVIPVSAWRQYLLVAEVAAWSVEVTQRLFDWFATLPSEPIVLALLQFVARPESVGQQHTA